MKNSFLSQCQIDEKIGLWSEGFSDFMRTINGVWPGRINRIYN